MILGLDRFPPARCFVEIDEAVRQLRGKDDVVFNAHAFQAEIPEGAIVYNFENVGEQLRDPAIFRGHRLWDFSARNVARWKEMGVEAEHVPVGYHESMRRFTPAKYKAIDVVHYGCLNERRRKVLDALAARGFHVQHIEGLYGAERDGILGRARLCVVPLFYEGGLWPALRVAHLVANGVPVVAEVSSGSEAWSYSDHCHPDGIINPIVPYDSLVAECTRLLDNMQAWLRDESVVALEAFKARPLVLPS